MKVTHILGLVFLAAIAPMSISAIDLRTDVSFPQLFAYGDMIHDAFIQSDGKIVVAGQVNTGSGNFSPLVRRFTSEGILDPTLNVTQLLPDGGGEGRVSRIVRLADGKFLVTGYFYAGTTFTSFARLNADGSLDGSLAYSDSYVVAAQPDGKLIACGQRVFNGETYRVAHRLNSNGSFDPSFRITFADGGGCSDAKVLPDGKILIAGGFTSGGQPLKQLHRVNTDGTRDATFEADIGTDVYAAVTGLTVAPDGKLLFRYFGQEVRRLFPNGSLDVRVSNCAGDIFLPAQDGGFLTTQCRKWPAAQLPFEVVRIFPDGRIDQSLDNIRFSGAPDPEIEGLLDAGGGSYFAYGHFDYIDNVERRALVRLVPNLTPPKARFDFDGDGRSDLAVFRPSDGVWYINQTTSGVAYRQWGLASDKPVASDVDHDGKTDVGVFRNGQWHAWSEIFGHQYMCLGTTGDIPFAAYLDDYLPKSQDYAVRGIRNGRAMWFIRTGGYTPCWLSNSQPSERLVSGELTSDKPVVGDFNGDSRDDLGYFRDGFWYTEDNSMDAAPKSFQWGSAGDIPVPGDYDGDRQADYAIFRPSTGEWWINRSTEGIIVIRFGLNGDVPVPADYDGDGKMDVAIFRNGVWWEYRIGTGTVYAEQWGVAGDIPASAVN